MVDSATDRTIRQSLQVQILLDEALGIGGYLK